MNTNNLPDFFILGVQKAATSSIHKILKQDYRISLPYQKETHFFSNNFDKKIEWYINQFKNKEYTLRGEVDPSYIFFKKSAINIKKYVKNPKFILILRKPIERAFSHYLMSKSRGYEEKSFFDALELEEKRLKTNSSFFLSHYSYLKRGNYYQQIIDFKNIFPKSKFLFLKYEDFKNIKKQKKFINMIYDFLNLKIKNNLNLSFHENKYGAMRFDFLRDLTHTNNNTRRFFKKLIPSEYLRFKIITFINNLNKIDSDKEKLNYKLLKNKYIKWNNEQTDLISKICDLDINDWKI